MSVSPCPAGPRWLQSNSGEHIPSVIPVYTSSYDIGSTLTNKLMVRVTNYFDTQIRIPIASGEKAAQMVNNMEPIGSTTPNGTTSSAFQTHLREAVAASKPMTNDQLTSWYGKILEGVKQRYRKLQRLAR